MSGDLAEREFCLGGGSLLSCHLLQSELLQLAIYDLSLFELFSKAPWFPHLPTSISPLLERLPVTHHHTSVPNIERLHAQLLLSFFSPLNHFIAATRHFHLFSIAHSNNVLLHCRNLNIQW
mmetsp:Transcript_3702/g.14084  ORF Transcript_3702/g.14084 Transcript_3702/m.14084 type:complete len:121 (+) Transcript_3702:1212-1574(+)